jgi:Zn-dependent M32 family carboxypeptidase
MPPQGAPQRALQIAAVAGVSHDLKTSPALGSILEKLKPVSRWIHIYFAFLLSPSRFSLKKKNI